MTKGKRLLATFFVVGLGAANGATITIDSVTRLVTSSVTGGTPVSASSATSGTFQNQASTDGMDSGTALAIQNTDISGGEIFSLYSNSDLMAVGSRGSGFAPVSLSSESLVDVTFTVPSEVGNAGFWIGGTYSVVGGAADGSPRVAWSLASKGASAETVFSGTGTSGSAVPLNQLGTISPGTYQLSLSARVGTAGPGGFVGSNAQGAAMFEDLSVIVSPITPVPEPSSALLVLLGSALFVRRRRHASHSIRFQFFHT